MELTQRVRGQFHDLRSQAADTGLELAVLASAEASLAEHGLDADEQLAARIRFAQFRCGILAVHHEDTAAAELDCLALLRTPSSGPASAFMQARVGMVVFADQALHDGVDFPREQFESYMEQVALRPERADDEFWFFTTLYAFSRGWVDVLARAEEQIIRHWEDESGIYLYRRVKLMRKLLAGTAKEIDCGQVLQAINKPLFANEFNVHLLAKCDGSGLMTPVNKRIWLERQAEFGVRSIK